jgi:hypothetical protein
VREDDRLAVAAAHQLGLVRTDEWPMLAAQLLAAGADGVHLIELAGQNNLISGWELDQLLPDALAEAGVEEADRAEAPRTVARVLAMRVRAGLEPGDYPIIRRLAPLAPPDYAPGLLMECYAAEEWLDCECHRQSTERSAAGDLEAELEGLPDLDVTPELLPYLAVAR